MSPAYVPRRSSFTPELGWAVKAPTWSSYTTVFASW